MSQSLQQLLSPVTLSEFFGRYFERDFLHVRGDARWGHLFSARGADELLWRHEAHLREFVRVHNNGRDLVPPSNLSALESAKWTRRQYAEGATVVINHLQDHVPALGAFLRDIEQFMLSRVSATAYLTPPQARGFRIHFDTHDVLIVQVEGAKHYDLFHDVDVPTLPLRRQSFALDASRYGTPVAQVDMAAGDLLYIPRGLVHVARTTGQRSLHLSLGLHPQRVVDILNTIAELAAEQSVDLRRSFLTLGREDLEALASGGETWLGVKITADQIIRRLTQRYVGSLRPLPSNAFEIEASPAELTPESWVERAPGQHCSIVPAGERVQIGFPGLSLVRDLERLPDMIEAPHQIEDAVRYIEATEEPFQVRSLPGTLTEASKVVLARQLLHEGLLRPVPSLV